MHLIIPCSELSQNGYGCGGVTERERPERKTPKSLPHYRRNRKRNCTPEPLSSASSQVSPIQMHCLQATSCNSNERASQADTVVHGPDVLYKSIRGDHHTPVNLAILIIYHFDITDAFPLYLIYGCWNSRRPDTKIISNLK